MRQRLLDKGHSPLVYESDTNVVYSIRTLRRFSSMLSLGMAFVATLAIAIFPAEIMAEFGVRVSDHCEPQRLRTSGICAHNVRKSFRRDFGVSFLVEEMRWDDNMLVAFPIRQGFRRNIDGSEYFGSAVQPNKSLPVVIADCKSDTYRILQPSEFRLKFGRNPMMNAKGVWMKSVLILNSSRSINGIGHVNDNYKFKSAFMVSSNPGEAENRTLATIYEYSHSKDIANISKVSRKNSKRGVTALWVRPKAPLLVYNLSCRISGLSVQDFTDAIFVYRKAQLNRSYLRRPLKLVTITVGGHTMVTPQPMRNSCVARATLTKKITEETICNGETFVWTKCATYNVYVAVPLLTIVGMLSSIYLLLRVKMTRDGIFARAPITAKAWGRFYIRICQNEKAYSLSPKDYEKGLAQYGCRDWIGEYIIPNSSDSSHFEVRRVKLTRSFQ